MVIAQVKRLAESRTLPAQAVRVPGIVVDAIVLAPDQLQTTQTALRPGVSVTSRRRLRASNSRPGPREGRRPPRAQELRDGEAVNLGFGISALVPRVLLEEGLDGSVTWVIEQGAVGGVPFLGFHFGCRPEPRCPLASPDQFTLCRAVGSTGPCCRSSRSTPTATSTFSTAHTTPRHGRGRRFRRHHGPCQGDRLLGFFTAGRRDIAVADAGLQIELTAYIPSSSRKCPHRPSPGPAPSTMGRGLPT